MRRLKKITLIIAVIFVGLFAGCEILNLLSHDENIPRGYVDCVEYFDEEGFQDYVDYCWYQYDSIEGAKLRSVYQGITDSEVSRVYGYFDNFRGWMEACNRMAQYDFDPSCINEGDSMLLFTKEGQHIGSADYGKYDNYSLYFFDKEAARLYYIHSNI